MTTKPAQNFLLCPRCRSNLSILSSDRDKVVFQFEFYRAPAQTALPVNTNHRLSLIAEMQPMVRTANIQRKTACMVRASQKRSSMMVNETLKQYRIHKWDKHLAAYALGIKAERLVERIGHYRRRGLIKRNGKGWVKVNRIAPTQF